MGGESLQGVGLAAMVHALDPIPLSPYLYVL